MRGGPGKYQQWRPRHKGSNLVPSHTDVRYVSLSIPMNLQLSLYEFNRGRRRMNYMRSFSFSETNCVLACVPLRGVCSLWDAARTHLGCQLVGIEVRWTIIGAAGYSVLRCASRFPHTWDVVYRRYSNSQNKVISRSTWQYLQFDSLFLYSVSGKYPYQIFFKDKVVIMDAADPTGIRRHFCYAPRATCLIWTSGKWLSLLQVRFMDVHAAVACHQE